MKTTHPRTVLAGAALALGVLLAVPAGAGASTHGALPALRAGAAASAFSGASSLPAASCSPSGSTLSCDLYAKAGQTDLPGALNVPVWAFVGSDAQTPVVPGGPVIEATEGQTVQLTLHNELPTGLSSTERLALALPQLPVVPDTSGVLPGDQRTYTFTADNPGTYVYEAGGAANMRHQVAMGLYGAIVVRPATGATAATLDTTGFADPNANLSFTAVTPGPDGNAITITYEDPGAAASPAPLSVSVTGTDIVVGLATDASDTIQSTAADVAAAVAANPAANALVTVSALGDGSGVVATLPQTSLSGGEGVAYGGSTAFDDEAVLVTSELDPAFSRSADPSAFDMQNWSPTYWLLGGRTYNDSGTIPSTDQIPTLPGHRVLLRYVNGGLLDHSMGLLGMHQRVIGQDGQQLPFSYDAGAETVAPGATMETIGAVPPAPRPGERLAVFDQGQHLDNAGAGWSDTGANGSTPVTAGGILSFLHVPGTYEPCGGPAPIQGTESAPATNGPPITIDAMFAGCAPAAPPGADVKDVTASEYFIDSPGADGTGTTVGVTAGSLATSEYVIDPTSAGSGGGALSSGQHILYTHAQDSAGKWGSYDTETFYYDLDGPATSALSLTLSPVNGTKATKLNGTASDLGLGDQNVTQAELFFDSAGANGTGTVVKLSVAGGAQIEALSLNITTTMLTALGEGNHSLLIHAKDSYGNWGPFASIPLVIDRTAPTVGPVSFGPSPNNGTISIDINTFELEVRAPTITDPVSGGTSSGVAAVEGFLTDTAPSGGNGTGTVFLPIDGRFNSSSEGAYVRLPLAQVNAMTPGAHRFYVHAKDLAGTWGPYSFGTIVIDKTGPAASAVAASPSVIVPGVTTTVALSATLTDPNVPGTGAGSNVVAAEYYVDTDPGKGNGVAMTGSFGANPANVSATVPVAGLSTGPHTLYVRGKDAAGNWGPVGSVVIGPPTALFADSFASGNLSAWSSSVGGAALAVTNAASMHGADGFGLAVTINGTAARYVQDNTPAAEKQYHARFYFNPHGAPIGTGATQDIFVALAANGTNVNVRVQLRRPASGFQLRIAARNGNATTNGSWFGIANNTAHSVEIAWQSAASGTATLYIDGVAQQTLSGLSSANQSIETVRLGPSGGSVAASTGTEYFDDFVSNRTSVIGP